MCDNVNYEFGINNERVPLNLVLMRKFLIVMKWSSCSFVAFLSVFDDDDDDGSFTFFCVSNIDAELQELKTRSSTLSVKCERSEHVHE